MGNLKHIFLKSVNRVAQQSAYAPPAEFADFDTLPQLLKGFFEYCGYSGKEQVESTHIEWSEAMIRQSKSSRWLTIDYFQLNFLWKPVRLAYLKARILGCTMVEGLDSFKDGKGEMQVKLLRLISLVNAKGKALDTAQLVTILAETILVPHYALQKYISWEVVDDFTLMGTIRYQGISANGMFFFNQSGACIRFETDCRSMMTKNNVFVSTPWEILVSGYSWAGQIRYPTKFSAFWNTGPSRYEYFKGTIAAIQLNHTSIFQP